MDPRLRHYLGNGLRLVTGPWRQRTIPMEDATTIFGCSFGPDGWHHIRETLKEYLDDPQRSWRDTTLARYLTGFSPASICELVAGGPCDLPLFTYPWGPFNPGVVGPKDAAQSRFCGPSTPEFVEAEYRRIIELYERMRKTGYRPWRYGNGFIGGTFLIAKDGRRRFVVLQGNHRMAILSILGVRRVAVREDRRHFLREVREADAEAWPWVRDGRFTPETARAVFRMFFEENGHHLRRWVAGEGRRSVQRHQGRGQ